MIETNNWVALSQYEILLLRSLLIDAGLQGTKTLASIDRLTSAESKDDDYRELARDLPWVRDGECEIDDHAVVSASDKGAYVMAWVWVDKPECS